MRPNLLLADEHPRSPTTSTVVRTTDDAKTYGTYPGTRFWHLVTLRCDPVCVLAPDSAGNCRRWVIRHRRVSQGFFVAYQGDSPPRRDCPLCPAWYLIARVGKKVNMRIAPAAMKVSSDRNPYNAPPARGPTMNIAFHNVSRLPNRVARIRSFDSLATAVSYPIPWNAPSDPETTTAATARSAHFVTPASITHPPATTFPVIRARKGPRLSTNHPAGSTRVAWRRGIAEKTPPRTASETP